MKSTAAACGGAHRGHPARSPGMLSAEQRFSPSETRPAAPPAQALRLAGKSKTTKRLADTRQARVKRPSSQLFLADSRYAPLTISLSAIASCSGKILAADHELAINSQCRHALDLGRLRQLIAALTCSR
ncbi:MAG: hypothetical protein IPP59_20300 [Betaproteobacteria bacterium]|nr:hypothetical protein [Candidatus Dechloromonas phosphorivorans]